MAVEVTCRGPETVHGSLDTPKDERLRRFCKPRGFVPLEKAHPTLHQQPYPAAGGPAQALFERSGPPPAPVPENHASAEEQGPIRLAAQGIPRREPWEMCFFSRKSIRNHDFAWILMIW